MEIQTQNAKSTEVVIPNTVTGYQGYVTAPHGWTLVVSSSVMQSNLLPLSWYLLKDEVIKAAQQPQYKYATTLKIISAEFEVRSGIDR